MPDAPAWRLGALGYALALAGYWPVRLPLNALDSLEGGDRRTYAAGDLVTVARPLVVLAGAIGVRDEPVGTRPRRLGRLDTGRALIPVGGHATRPGVRLEAAEGLDTLALPEAALYERARADAELMDALVEGLRAAVAAQHWALRLAGRGEPAARLAALLLEIAEDVGVCRNGEVLLEGAPDVREMAVLAGISRESAVIALAWLVHTGVLSREAGRLRVVDLSALRHTAGEGA